MILLQVDGWQLRYCGTLGQARTLWSPANRRLMNVLGGGQNQSGVVCAQNAGLVFRGVSQSVMLRVGYTSRLPLAACPETSWL